MKNRARAYIYLLSATAIWGAAGPIIKFTLGGIDPFPFLSYRLFISAIFGAFILFKLRPNVKSNLFPKIILYSLLASTFALGFLFLGLDKTSVIEAGLIGAIGPLTVLLGGAVFLKERIAKNEKVGVIIAFSGTILTIITPLLTPQNSFKLTGNILLLAFLLTDAASILIAKRLMKKIDPLVMTSCTFIIGAATIIPYTILTTEYDVASSIINMPLKYHLGVWYMAVASGTIAYSFFMKGVKLIEAGEAILFSYLQPVFSIPLAVFWLGEDIRPKHIIGAIVIAVGVYIAEKRSR